MAVCQHDTEWVKDIAGHLVLQVGRSVMHHVVLEVLESAVTLFFSFILETPTDCHVVACIATTLTLMVAMVHRMAAGACIYN